MQLTENFSLSEFECKSGAEMPDNVRHNIQKLANQLQCVRNRTGKPIIITSGYRSPSHNHEIGGSPKSQHQYGKACDFKVEGLEPKQVYLIIEKLIQDGDMLQGGLGLYPTWVHYDFRGTRTRW